MHGQQLANPAPLSCKSKLFCEPQQHDNLRRSFNTLSQKHSPRADCTPTATGARVNPTPSLAGQNCIANHYSMTICRSLNTKIQPLSWLHMITHRQQLVNGLVVQPQSYVTQFINKGTLQALGVLLQKSPIYASLCVPPPPHSHSLLSQGSKVFSTSESLTRTFHLQRC